MARKDRQYLVTWTYQTMHTSPEAAARLASEVMLSGGAEHGGYTEFSVLDQETGQEFDVDVAKPKKRRGSKRR